MQQLKSYLDVTEANAAINPHVSVHIPYSIENKLSLIFKKCICNIASLPVFWVNTAVLVFLTRVHFIIVIRTVFSSPSPPPFTLAPLQFSAAHMKKPELFRRTFESLLFLLATPPILPHHILGSSLYFHFFCTLRCLLFPPTGPMDMLRVHHALCFRSCFFASFLILGSAIPALAPSPLEDPCSVGRGLELSIKCSLETHFSAA